MKLHDFLKTKRGTAHVLAEKMGTHPVYLYNLGTKTAGGATLEIDFALRLHEATGGTVSFRESVGEDVFKQIKSAIRGEK